MVDEPRVNIVSEPGAQKQFGRGRLSYQSSKGKLSAPVILASLTTLLVSIVTLIFAGNPKKDRADRASQFLGIQVPMATLSTGVFNVPPMPPKGAVGTTPKTGGGAPVRLLGPQLIGRPRNVPIPPGSMVEATLISGASDGPVKAELKDPLTIAGETLLEVGTVLMGTGQSGEDRLAIHFRKAVFRDGTTSKVNAQAADDSDRIPGIKGSHVGYRALKLAAGVGLNFAAGMAQGLEDTQGQSGAVVAPPSMKNAFLNGAARASLDDGQEMMNEYRSEKPVITVAAGTVIMVLFDDDK